MDFWWCLFNWYFVKWRHLSSEEHPLHSQLSPSCSPLFLTLSSLETTFSFFCWTFPLFRLRHDSNVCSLDRAGNAPYWQQGSSRVCTPPLPRSKNVFPLMFLAHGYVVTVLPVLGFFSRSSTYIGSLVYFFEAKGFIVEWTYGLLFFALIASK